MTEPEAAPGNGFDVSGWGLRLSGRGQSAVIYLILFIFVASIAMSLYLTHQLIQVNAEGFGHLGAAMQKGDEAILVESRIRSQEHHYVLEAIQRQTDDLRCLTWVLATKEVRERLIPPECVKPQRRY